MIYSIKHVARSVQVAVIKGVTHGTLDLLDEPRAAEIDERQDPIQNGEASPEEPGRIAAAAWAHSDPLAISGNHV